MKKNRVLKNDYLVFASIAPIYLLVAVAVINAHFNVEVIDLPNGGIRVIGVSLLYPVFIMLPLGIGNGVFCFYAYLKALVCEVLRRNNPNTKEENSIGMS